MNPWTKERHEQMVALALSGASASQIAAQIGGTRNSIIGRCGRTGIKLGVGRHPPKAAKPKPEPKPKPIFIPAPSRLVKTDTSIRPIVESAIPLLERASSQCAFLLGDHRAQPAMCCGKDVAWRKNGTMTSWCTDHSKLVYTATQPATAPRPALDYTLRDVRSDRIASIMLQARAFG